MISAIGKRLQLSSGTAGRPAGGFTMIEILVVLAIIMLLFSMTMIAMARYYTKGSVSATEALFQRIEDGLESYRSLTGHYPPDGFDSEVKNSQGEALKGSACLHHFLGEEITIPEDIAGEKRYKKIDALIEFREADLCPEIPDHPGVREIRDAFNFPIHYDNTENGRFEPQDGSEHVDADSRDDHPPDPREAPELGSVKVEGIQNKKGFDLWSYGNGKHAEHQHLKSVIASWNIGKKKED